MSAEPRGALSRRHVIGTFVAGAAGLALPIGAAGQADAAAPAGAVRFRRATVSHLGINGRGDELLGVDDAAPRLSWKVTNAPAGWTQAAYQIRAANGDRELAHGPYLWDSGKVRSDAQIDIPWGGRALQSRQTIVWQVRAWSTRGDVTEWSRSASWEMGLLKRSDWGKAEWIEYPGRSVGDPLPIFARAFKVGKGHGAKVTKARLYISGAASSMPSSTALP